MDGYQGFGAEMELMEGAVRSCQITLPYVAGMLGLGPGNCIRVES